MSIVAPLVEFAINYEWHFAAGHIMLRSLDQCRQNAAENSAVVMLRQVSKPSELKIMIQVWLKRVNKAILVVSTAETRCKVW